MYLKNVTGGAAVPALAYTGLSVGWWILGAVVLIGCGLALYRISRSSPKQFKS